MPFECTLYGLKFNFIFLSNNPSQFLHPLSGHIFDHIRLGCTYSVSASLRNTTKLKAYNLKVPKSFTICATCLSTITSYKWSTHSSHHHNNAFRFGRCTWLCPWLFQESLDKAWYGELQFRRIESGSSSLLDVQTVTDTAMLENDIAKLCAS